MLFEVAMPSDGGVWRHTLRPGVPLRDSALLVNGHKELQIGTQVALELQAPIESIFSVHSCVSPGCD